tara:strand:- start:50 stop:742 length:693 start_codon:yes stop_codon:yes gene_type:complete
MKSETLKQIQTDRREKRPVVLVTNLKSGQEQLVYPDDLKTKDTNLELWTAAERAQRMDKSQTITIDGDDLFLHVFNAPLRMIIVGAVHIAQPLALIASLTEFDVTIVDPRRSFATPERFPRVKILHQWPDKGLQSLSPDRRTAVVTLTHDPKLDDAALSIALKSTAFYIGALGSKKTHDARLKRLNQQNFNDTELNRIHGPVGLSIHATSPAEIAISIMGEVVTQLRTNW